MPPCHDFPQQSKARGTGSRKVLSAGTTHSIARHNTTDTFQRIPSEKETWNTKSITHFYSYFDSTSEKTIRLMRIARIQGGWDRVRGCPVLDEDENKVVQRIVTSPVGSSGNFQWTIRRNCPMKLSKWPRKSMCCDYRSYPVVLNPIDRYIYIYIHTYIYNYTYIYIYIYTYIYRAWMKTKTKFQAGVATHCVVTRGAMSLEGGHSAWVSELV